MPVVCRSCGTENDDSVDFCRKCGEYLRWELTRTMPAAIQLEGATPAPMPASGTEPLDSTEPEEPEESEEPEEPGEPEEPDEFDDAELDTMVMAPHAAPMPAGVGTASAPGVNTATLAPLMPVFPSPAPVQETIPITGGATLVVTRVGDLELEPTDVAIGNVEAGSQIGFEFLLRNVSRLVDNYDLVVAGLPEEWARTDPATAYLVPYGSGGTSDQLVRVVLTPPRSSESEARVWPFELIALSRATGGIAARAPAGIDVGPYSAWEVLPEPMSRAGRFRGHYSVTVTNRGNAPVELWMYATDANNRLRGRFVDRVLPLSAGESRTTRLDVRVPRPRPLGRALDHRATVEALPDEPDPEDAPLRWREQLKKFVTPGSVSVSSHGVRVRRPKVKMPRPPQRQLKLDDLKRLSGGEQVGPLAPTQVTFRQKAVIPTWLIILALIIGAIVALYLLTRNHQVEVPELVGLRSTFVAQQRIQKRGLVLNPTLRRDVTSLVHPGTIVAQYPAAGKHVDKATQVTLDVAVGTGKVAVPNLTGKTRAEADTDLRHHNLSLGDAEPVTAPLTDIVGSQIPVPGLSVPEGTPIQVFLHAKPKHKSATGPGGASSSGSPSSPSSGSAAAKAPPIKIPAINGLTEVKYATEIGREGLIPQIVHEIAGPAAGSLYQVKPAPGTAVKKGSNVELFVSEGIPDIAFDNGTQIHVVDPSSGKALGTAKQTGSSAIEPSFSPDGTEFVYRSAEKVFLAKAVKPASAKTIYQGTDLYTNVTFAPDPSGTVLALDRQLEGVGELCLARLTNQKLHASCLPDDGWSLGRDISWSPNGKQILAFGSRPGDPSTFGILRFTTKHAFSTDPSQWSGSMATDVTVSGHGVIGAAFAPNGKTVALVSNLGSPGFTLSLVKPGSLDPTTGKKLPVAACAVAWRPDGKDLSVVQSNAACSSTTGQIVQFALNTPRNVRIIASGAANVTYQSIEQPSDA